MSEIHVKSDHARTFMAVARWCVFLLLASVPIVYMPVGLDALELHKQTLVIVLGLIAALAWIGAMVADRRIALHRGWMNIPPITLLTSVLVSAAISIGPYRSWIGSSGQDAQSFIAIAALVLIFFVTANAVRSERSHKTAFFMLLCGSTAASWIGTWSLLHGETFNTIGSMNAFGVFLAVVASLAQALWVADRPESGLYHTRLRLMERLMILLFSFSALIAFLIIDYWAVWTVLLAGLALVFVFLIARPSDFAAGSKAVLPFLMIAVALPMSLWIASPFPAPPAEVTPSLGASRDIAVSALKEHSALFGSGPGTFPFAYAEFHGTDVNETPLWNRHFDQGSSFALTALVSFGVIGAMAWLLFWLSTVLRAMQEIITRKAREEWMPTYVLLVPFVALIVALSLYTVNMTMMFLMFALAGLIASQVMKREFETVLTKNHGFAIGAAAAFVVISLMLVTMLFIAGQRYAAETAFAKAVRLDRDDAPLGQVTRELDRAATFNRFNDAYFRNLAQAYLLRAAEEIDRLEDAEAEEGRSKLIQAFTFASVNASARAVALSPHDVNNWRVRGSVMREFLPLVKGAREQAVSAFRRAVELEPANPKHSTELGKTYLAAAEQARSLMGSEDDATRAAAQKDAVRSLEKAEEAFERAIALKGDYAPAHFRLGLVLEGQGRINEAVAKMQSVAKHNPLDVGVQFQLGLLHMRRGQEGDLARAEQAFAEAIELSPSYTNARWYLASVYEQQGRIEEALEQVLKVRQLNPDDPSVNARLERLREGVASQETPPPVEEGTGRATDAE